MFKSYFKDNIVILTGHFMLYAQALLLTPLVIKTSGAAVYGGYMLAVSLTGFIFGISSFGVGFRCARFLPSAPDMKARRELVFQQMFFHALSISFLSLLLALTAPFIRSVLFKEVAVSLELYCLLLYALFFQHQLTNYFRYTGRMGYFNYGTVTVPYVNISLLLLWYFRFHQLNVNVLIVSDSISRTLVMLPLFLKMMKEIGFCLPALKFPELKSDILLGFPLVCAFVVDFVLSASDRYVIAFFMTVKDVAYYAAAYALGSVILFFAKASGVVLTQLLSKTMDGNQEENARNLVNYTIRGFFLVSIPFNVGSFILSKPLLTLFANAQAAERACWVTPLVALGSLFYGLNLILSNVLFVRMKTSIIFKSNVLASVLNVALNMIFIFTLRNILVPAVVTLLSYFVAFLFVHRKVVSDWPVDFSIGTILKSLAASCVMGLFLIAVFLQPGFPAHRLSYLLAAAACAILIYSVVLFALKTFSQKELLFLKKVFS